MRTDAQTNPATVVTRRSGYMWVACPQRHPVGSSVLGRVTPSPVTVRVDRDGLPRPAHARTHRADTPGSSTRSRTSGSSSRDTCRTFR